MQPLLSDDSPEGSLDQFDLLEEGKHPRSPRRTHPLKAIIANLQARLPPFTPQLSTRKLVAAVVVGFLLLLGWRTHSRQADARLRLEAAARRRVLSREGLGGPQGVVDVLKQRVLQKEELLTKAAPARSLYDALKPELRYLICDSWSGLTGHFLTALSLIHLAQETHRVAIIPDWHDYGHYGDEVISMSDLFDMGKFRNTTGALFVEMQDVKPLDRDHTKTKKDKLSCYQGLFTNALSFGHHNIEQQLLTDPLPRGWSFEAHVMFDLEAQGRLDRTKEVAVEQKLNLSRNVLEEQADGTAGLLCHSNIWDLRQAGGGMWTGPKGGMTDLLITERRGIRPEWFKWGHYIDFVAPVWTIAEESVRGTFDLAPGEPLPNFITVHIRRGDFLTWCPKGQGCVPSLAEYEPPVKEWLRDAPLGTKVLVTTNEADDLEFLALIARKGWHRVDHLKLGTAKKLAAQFGEKRALWADAVVDQAILSMGRDFVGTEGSQVSWVSELRVSTWRGGRSVMVQRPR